VRCEKRDLVTRFSRNRWNLFADIDERFDYPYSDVLAVRNLLTYLNDNAYTAVLAPMLDLFADGPLDGVRSNPDDSLKEKYPYYDISAVEKHDYHGASCVDPTQRQAFRNLSRRMVAGY
jgi:hypothetical protein